MTTQVLAVVTIVAVGMLVGVEFSVAFFVNAILNALPGDMGLRGRMAGAKLLGRVMPFWYIGSAVLGAVWAATGGGGLVLVGVILLALSVVMSIVLLVPINSRVAKWDETGVPEGWRGQLGAWDRYHYARVAVLVAALAVVASAVA
ncbi:anthrone oxygenase family protein [Streptomyces sp. SPB074]|uniref:anthrone oxygenase family protein n=1 Tax=Streptomyces sp. (strain SPB074) TaxID=465543 RepID=UPI0001D1E227|nr:anthrone oxygenase family protein [Streptomyces sp. SPB074]EFG65144.1 membrane protein [Streptomyces sp. SPB074]